MQFGAAGEPVESDLLREFREWFTAQRTIVFGVNDDIAREVIAGVVH